MEDILFCNTDCLFLCIMLKLAEISGVSSKGVLNRGVGFTNEFSVDVC